MSVRMTRLVVVGLVAVGCVGLWSTLRDADRLATATVPGCLTVSYR